MTIYVMWYGVRERRLAYAFHYHAAAADETRHDDGRIYRARRMIDRRVLPSLMSSALLHNIIISHPRIELIWRNHRKAARHIIDDDDADRRCTGMSRLVYDKQREQFWGSRRYHDMSSNSSASYAVSILFIIQ